MAEILWTDNAAQDFEDIGTYIGYDSPKSREKIIRRIGEAMSFLAHHPNVRRSGRVEGTRELVVSGTPYIVIYRVANSRVEIITILHAAQRWPNTSD